MKPSPSDQSPVSLSLSKQDTAVLKGVAILAMLCHHLYTYPPAWAALPESPFLLWLGAVGKVCVSLFLFCSGYGLSVQYATYDSVVGFSKRTRIATRFLIRRFVKFYANYWVIFILFVPITVLFFGRPFQAAYGESASVPLHFFLDLLGLQGLHSYNITWWFNLLIIVFYLLFPIFYFLFRKNVWVSLFIAFILCAIGGKLGLSEYGLLFSLYILPFTIGISWRFFQESFSQLFQSHKQKSFMFVVGCLGLIVLLLFFRQHNVLPGGFYGEKIDGFLVCAIVMLIISLRPFFPPPGFLMFVGKHSVNIYLIHTFINAYWPTSRWIHNLEWGGVKFIILFAMSLLISVFIELIKEKIGYNGVVSYICKRYEDSFQ